MTVIGVVSDTHCEPGEADALPQAVLDALAGSDLIVHCGDIIDRHTLDRLAELAPLVAVRSPVDPAADGIVLFEAPHVLERDGVRIGLLSRPADLAGHADLAAGPLTDVATLVARATAVFDGPVDVVLYRGSHGAHVEELDGVLTVDPGSPTCWDGASATVGRLHLEAGTARYEVVDITARLPLRFRWGWRSTRLRQDLIMGAYAWRRSLGRRAQALTGRGR